MRYNPGELLAKLQDMGVAIDTDNPMRKKAREIREGRHKPIVLAGVDKKIDYTPAIDGKGRPLKEIPVDYVKDVLNFIGYMADTAKRSFKIKMQNVVTGEGFIKWKPYVHRWTEIYKRGVLAKFYQLEAYLKEEPKSAVLISLTVSTRNKTYEQVLSELTAGRKKILDVLRWKFDTQDYFWCLEPHKSGFAHLHLIYFYSISESDQVFLKNLWSEKYGYGSFENGIDFSLPCASSDGSCPAGAIASIRNYAMKYVSKGLHSGSSHEIEFMGLKVPLEMSLGELLFNAILKKTKSRLWGCSRHFSEVMKRPVKERSEDWECIEVDQYYGFPADEVDFYPDESEAERQKHSFSVLWTKEGGLRPDEMTWKFVNDYYSMSQVNFLEPLTHYKLKGYKFEELPGGRVAVYAPVWTRVVDCPDVESGVSR